MANLTIDSAKLTGGVVTGSGTGTGQVECRVRVTANGVDTWIPASGWQQANMNGNNWTVSITIPPGTPPPPAEYRLFARNGGGKGVDAPVATGGGE
jgi:hypothetical protein